MSRVAPRRTSSRSVRATIAATATACLIAVAALAVSLGGARGQSPEPPRAERQVQGAGEVVTASVGRRTGAVVPEAPRSVRLPSGTTVPVRAVSTTAEGTLDVPDDVNVAGWWEGGSRLGDPFGSNLVAAHVDSSSQGLGPYAELLTAEAGQSIVVTSATLSQEYVISSLELLPKSSLADNRWIYSASGIHRLTLVTCAGPYDASRGGYRQLAVVIATAVGEPTQRES